MNSLPSSDYSPTKPSKIGDELTKLFASLEDPDSTYTRTANANLILLVSSSEKLKEIEPIIDLFSYAHPCRFFLIYTDNSLAETKVDISARCHGLSKSEHVCSEIVRLGVAAKSFSSIPSVIRGNLLTGMPTELFIYDASVPEELISLMAPLAEQILFDSQSFSALTGVPSFIKLPVKLIDCEWIGLGIWRDEIRIAFDKLISGGGTEALTKISEIHIRTSSSKQKEPVFAAYLLAGWICQRLLLSKCKCQKLGAYSLSGKSGQTTLIDIKHEVGASSNGPQLNEVVFVFGANGNAKPETLTLSRSTVSPLGAVPQSPLGAVPQSPLAAQTGAACVLETTLQSTQHYKNIRPFEADDLPSRLKRYFLIGESTINYQSALKHALALLDNSAPR